MKWQASGKKEAVDTGMVKIRGDEGTQVSIVADSGCER